MGKEVWLIEHNHLNYFISLEEKKESNQIYCVQYRDTQ
jgi:hypothetical protein